MPEPQPVTTTTTVTASPGGHLQVSSVTRYEPLTAFGRWMGGLLAGFIKGGAHSVTSSTIVGLVLPKDFNLGNQLHQTLSLFTFLFIAHGIVSGMFYLQSHPLPEGWSGENRRKSEEDERLG